MAKPSTSFHTRKRDIPARVIYSAVLGSETVIRPAQRWSAVRALRGRTTLGLPCVYQPSRRFQASSYLQIARFKDVQGSRERGSSPSADTEDRDCVWQGLLAVHVSLPGRSPLSISRPKFCDGHLTQWIVAFSDNLKW